MLDVVTLGEVMALFSPTTAEPLRFARQFELRWGGAEVNFAIALTRLGLQAGLLSLLGDDEMGRLILHGARGEGVDVSRVQLLAGRRTGLYLKQFVAGRTEVFYYREGSAASRLGPDDLDPEYFRQARWLHLTGITAALSDSCLAALWRALDLAEQYGLTISFDPNMRFKLWSLAEARAALTPLMQRCDVLLAGEEELLPLLGLTEREAAIQTVLGWRRPMLALKLGAEGALIATPTERVISPGLVLEQIVDPVGAGDGFDAGFVAGQLMGWDLAASARLGNIVGASALGIRGDFEAYPTLAEAQAWLEARPNVAR
jgi:2-dehydro-3-deoxygluconokinase